VSVCAKDLCGAVWQGTVVRRVARLLLHVSAVKWAGNELISGQKLAFIVRLHLGRRRGRGAPPLTLCSCSEFRLRRRSGASRK
jgi:hypothetical protein